LEQQEEAAQHLLLSPMTTLSHKYYHWCSEHIKYNHSSQAWKNVLKLDKLFRLYIQPWLCGNTTSRLHSTCRLSNSCRNNGGGGIELIVVVDPDMVTQLGSARFLHIKYNPWSQSCKWIRGLICRTIHAIFNSWLSCYCDCSWWCSTSRLNRSWCRWNRRRKCFIIVMARMI
jgi:hypothetical protein